LVKSVKSVKSEIPGKDPGVPEKLFPAVCRDFSACLLVFSNGAPRIDYCASLVLTDSQQTEENPKKFEDTHSVLGSKSKKTPENTYFLRFSVALSPRIYGLAPRPCRPP
jgi:hypothetical protein